MINLAHKTDYFLSGKRESRKQNKEKETAVWLGHAGLSFPALSAYRSNHQVAPQYLEQMYESQREIITSIYNVPCPQGNIPAWQI